MFGYALYINTVASVRNEEVCFMDDNRGFEWYIERIISAVRISDYRDAEGWARKAIASDPSRPEGFNFLGLIFDMKRDTIQAQKYYRAAIALDPTFHGAWANLDRSVGIPEGGHREIRGNGTHQEKKRM